MSEITIGALQITDYQGEETYAELRYVSNRNFTDSDGIDHIGGTAGFYQKVEGEISGTVISFDEHTTQTTDDALINPNVKISVEVWVGVIPRKLCDYKENLVIPTALLNSTTWDDIALWNKGRGKIPLPGYPTWTDFFNRLSVILDGAVKATTSVFGILRLKTTPVNIADPIAVGDNDTRLVDNLANYGGDLQEAIDEIASTETVLTITEPVFLSADRTLPSNIHLDIQGLGLIEFDNNVVLTVNSFIDPGNRRVFDTSASGSSVRFGSGAVSCLNSAWWAGNDDDADVTAAFNQMLASAAFAGGTGNFYLPQLTPEVDGEIDFTTVNSVTIFGNGSSPSGAAGYGTALRLKSSSSADYLFKVGEGRSSIRWRDLTLYANDIVADGVLFEGTGGAGTGSIDFSFTNVAFHGFRRGFYHHSLGASWQLAQVGFYQCFWIDCDIANDFNSVNGEYTYINPFISMGADQIGFNIQSSGALNVIGYEFAGSTYVKTFTGASVNTATNIVTIAAHGFADLAEVAVTTSGAKPTTSPANGLNGLIYIKKLTDDTFKFSSSSDGLTIIDLTTTGTGTQTITERTSKVCVISGSHGALNFTGGQDEACDAFIINNASDINGIVNIDKSLLQSRILLNQACQVNVKNSNHPCHIFQGSPSQAYIVDEDNNIQPFSINDGTATSYDDISLMTGGGIVTRQNNATAGNHITRVSQKFSSGSLFVGSPSTPVVQITSQNLVAEGKVQLLFGLEDSTGTPTIYYTLKRSSTDGWAELYGNQVAATGLSPNVGFRGNYPFSATNFVGGVITAKQITANQSNYFPLDPGTAAAMDGRNKNWRLSSDASRNITGLDIAPIAGEEHIITNVGAFSIVLVNDATSTAANRFLCSTGGNITLLPNESAYIQYDSVVSRWRVNQIFTGVIGSTVQAWSSNLDEYSAVNPTPAGLALLDDANAAAQLITLGINATVAEINAFNDVSAYTETIAAAGAISATAKYTKLALAGAGAVTLAAPSASILGMVKIIEVTVDNGDTTLALTNIEGQSSGTTATFNDVGDKLILVAGVSKWTVIKEQGITLS